MSQIARVDLSKNTNLASIALFATEPRQASLSWMTQILHTAQMCTRLDSVILDFTFKDMVDVDTRSLFTLSWHTLDRELTQLRVIRSIVIRISYLPHHGTDTYDLDVDSEDDWATTWNSMIRIYLPKCSRTSIMEVAVHIP